MKVKLYILACMSFMHYAVKAQMKIGDNPTSINSASLLELESTNKGLVFPNVSLTNVTLPGPLPTGLLTGTVVYNINTAITGGNGAGLYIWNGSVWMYLSTGSISSTAWSLTGNNVIDPANSFIGTINAADFVVKTNNTERLRILGASAGFGQAGWMGVGIALPRSVLDIVGSASNTNVFTIQNTSNTGYSSIDIRDDAGNLVGTLGYVNTGVSGQLTGKDYFSIYDKDFAITTNSSTYNFFIQGSSVGYVGINTGTPQQRLHVNGRLWLDSAFMPGGNAGVSGYVLTSSGANLAPTWQPNIGNNAWLTTGNIGTNSGTNFLGTIDQQGLAFRVNNEPAGFLGISQSSYATSFGVGSSAGFQATALGAGAQATGGDAALAIGYQAIAGKQNAVAIGTSANASFDESIVIGPRASSGTFRGIAIGADAAVASNTQNIAIGYNAKATVDNGIAIGSNATTSNNAIAMAIGLNAQATGYISAAIGHGSKATGQNTLAFGNAAIASALQSMAIGNSDTASANNALSIGNFSVAKGIGSNAIGMNTVASGVNASTFGENSTASGDNSIAIGNSTKAQALNAIAMGNNATANGASSLSIGTNSQAALDSTMSFGTAANASASRTLSIGNSSAASAANAMAIGNNAAASANLAVAIGNLAQANKGNALALGYKTTASGNSSIAIGDQSTASGNNAITLGYNTTVQGNNSVAIGNSLSVLQNNSIILGDSATIKVGIGTYYPSYKLHVIANKDPVFLAGVQATSAFTTDSILTIFNGVVKKAPYSSILSSISATAPLTYNSTTGVLGITQATTSGNGYLSSTDWNTFNNKVGNIIMNGPGLIYNTPINFTVSGGTATGTFSLLNQNANSVLAGPASGAAATPTFRALVAADIPSLAGSYIQNQTTQQASSNFNISGNGTIGGNLNVAGTSTLSGTVNLTSFLLLNGQSGTLGQVLTSNGAGNAPTWQNPGGGGGGGWLLLGNSGISSSTNFVGTINDQALVFKTGGTLAGFVGSTNDGLGKTSFGQLANAGDQNATAFGRNANASANAATALGYSAGATQQNAVAVGVNAVASQTAAIAMGFNSAANAQQSIAIGNAASASNSVNNIAIGTSAVASVQNGIAIGPNAKANNQLTAMALGNGAIAGGQSSTAIGDGASSTGLNSLALGVGASASGTISIAIGNSASATGPNTIAAGNLAKGFGLNSTVYGYNAQATVDSTIAIGANTQATAVAATVLGNLSQATKTNSLAVGHGANASGINSAAIGYFAGASVDNAFVLGNGLNNIGIGTGTPTYRLTVVPQSGKDPLYVNGVQNLTNPVNTDSILAIRAGVVKQVRIADLPLSTSYIQNQTTQQASSNFNISGNGTIGTNLNVTGTSTLSGTVNLASLVLLNGAAGNSGQVLTSNGAGIAPTWQPAGVNNRWSINGNSGTNASNFIGTADSVDLVVKAANLDRIHILGKTNGNSKAGWIGMGGITVARSPVDMAGDFASKNVLTIQNTNTNGYSSIDFLENGGGSPVGTFGYANPGTGVPASGKNYFYFYNKDFIMSAAGTGTPDFFIRGNSVPANLGFIGINTNTPTERLDVNGNVRVVGLIYPSADNAYTLGRSGNRWSQVWAANGTIQTSDIRLKKNIRPLKYGLKDILKIDPISYSWKTDSADKVKLGLSAQQLQTTLPEVVEVGTDKEKILGVNYSDIIPVLINAIKDQNTQIESQQKQLNKQQEQIDILLKELQNIKTEMKKDQITINK